MQNGSRYYRGVFSRCAAWFLLAACLLQCESHAGDSAGGSMTTTRGGTASLHGTFHDGNLDESFNSPSGVGAIGQVGASLLQPDGKVVIAGNFGSLFGKPSSGVARLNRDGSLDATFTTTTNTSGAPMALALQSDGKLVVAGTILYFNDQECNRIVRLNTDGTTDPNFQLSGCDEDIVAVAIQPDGKILVGGAFTNIGGSLHPRIARLNRDGTVDAAFRSASTSGKVLAIALDADGRIYVGGDFNEWAGIPQPRHLVRLNPNGRLDTTFVPEAGPELRVRCIVPEPGGTVIVTGDTAGSDSGTPGVIVRLHNNGKPDPSFEANIFGYIFHALRLPGGGYIVCGYIAEVDGVPRNFVARLKPDGSLDPAFDTSLRSVKDCSQSVNTTTLDVRGDLIIGGYFCEFDGQAWNGLARLHNTLPPHVVDLGFSPPLSFPAGVSQIYAWGINNFQQTNVPARLNNVSAIAAGSAHTLALSRDGLVAAWGDNRSNQTVIPPGLSRVMAIAAGSDHSVALKEDGTVVAWGSNEFGQTKVPVGLSNITAIAAGNGHSVALKREGGVVVWGDNQYGQRSLSAGVGHLAAIASGRDHTLGLRENGAVVSWGRNNDGQTNVPAELGSVIAIAAGNFHSLALKSDGTVVGWGRNDEGQTTIPPGLNDVIAIAAGAYHSVALKNDGTVVAWGDNRSGQSTVPGDLTGVTAIVAGGYSTTALKVATPSITAALADSNGDVVAVEAVDDPVSPYSIVHRYHPDGSTDPTFNYVSTQKVGRVARQPDGRYLVSSFRKDSINLGLVAIDFVRLNHDGSLDGSFGPFVFHSHSEALGRFEAADDSRIYLMLRGSINAEPYSTRLRRLFADGSVDRTFSVTTASIGLPNFDERVNDFAIQSGSRVIIGGGFTQLQSRARNKVARLNGDGTLDVSGFVDPKVTGGDVTRLVLQGDGKIVIAGDFTGVNGVPRPGLARLDPTGAFDSSFAPITAGSVSSLRLERGGGVLLAGAVSAGAQKYLLRLTTNGVVDTSFAMGTGPDVPPGDLFPIELFEASDGAHFVAGTFHSFDGFARPALVRLRPNPVSAPIAAGFALENVGVVEGNVSATIIAKRTGDVTAPLVLNYSATNGAATSPADFGAVSGSLQFAPGEIEKSFAVTIHPDAAFEGDEVMNLRLKTTNGAPLAGSDHIWLSILEDELPAGSLDKSFNPPAEGPSVGPAPGVVNFVNSLPDGGVLISGYFSGYGDLADLGNLLRLKPDGSIDEQWIARLNYPPECEPATLGEGSVLVAGKFTLVNDQPRRVLARLDPDGSLNTQFSTLTTDIASPQPTQVLRTPNQRILLAGKLGDLNDGTRSTKFRDDGVVRLFYTGKIDTDFVPFGIPAANSGNDGTYSSIACIARASGGDVYLGGSFNLLSLGGGRGLTRLNGNGSLDTKFKPNIEYGAVLRMAVQPDGRIIIGGNFYAFQGRATLARLNTDGSIDPTFDCHLTDLLRWFQVLDNGQIVGGGANLFAGGAFRSGLVRLNTDGTLDRSFRPDLMLGASYGALFGGDIDEMGRVLIAGDLVKVNGERRIGVARVLSVASSADNLRPQVSLTSPADGAEFDAEAVVPLSAIASDDKGIVRVEFHDGLQILGTDTTSPYELQAPALTPGSHTLFAVAIDTDGAATESSSITVSVKEPPPTVRLASTSLVVSESGSAKIILRKSGGEPTEVAYSITTGSATPGLDFILPASNTVNLPAGGGDFSLEIFIVDDFFAEESETFSVQLTGASNGFKVLAPAKTSVAITDDDLNAAIDSFPTNHSPEVLAANTGLRVTLSSALGQWRLSWEPFWRNAGSAATGIPPGDYEVAFKPIPGFANPANLSVHVRAGFVDPYNYTYLADPSVGLVEVLLRSNKTPELPLVLDGSGWQLDHDGTNRTSAVRLEGVPAGRHLIYFSRANVPGWSTPETAEVVVIPGQTAVITANYLAPVVCPASDISQPASVSLGVLDDTVNPQLNAVGQISSEIGAASGIAVRERVVLTAAHALFDDVTLAPVGQIQWRPARVRQDDNPNLAREPRPLSPRGSFFLSGYARERTNDIVIGGKPPGTVTAGSSRQDAAAMWFTEPAARGAFAGYLVNLKDRPGGRDWFVGSKIILAGYPIVGGDLCPPFPGILRKTDPLVSKPDTSDIRVYTFTDFRSFRGNSGGPVFAQVESGAYHPAGIYLGDGLTESLNLVSRVRVIDTDVLELINRAASSANAGTNFTSGGVLSFMYAAGLGPSSLQRLTVNLTPATGKWRVIELPALALTNSGSSVRLPTPLTATVVFSDVPGYVTPANYVISMTKGQDAILDVAYERIGVAPPALLVSSAGALTVNGTAGTTVRLQYRAALSGGVWTDVSGKSFLLSTTPVSVLTLEEGKAKPGFYRVITE